MSYIPISQLKEKGQTGYIPVAQLRGKEPTFSPVRFQDDLLGSFAQTTPQVSEDVITPQSLLKIAGQGLARAWAATGAKIAETAKLVEGDTVNPKTFFGISPIMQKLGVAIFGKEKPFNAKSEDIELLETFGVEKDIAGMTGGSLTLLFSTLDVTGAGTPIKGVAGLVRALKLSNNIIDASKAMKAVNFADEIITEYAPLFVKAKTTKEVKNVLEGALKLQSSTTGRGYRPIAELRGAAEVAPRIVPELESLAQEARKYKSAEEFVNEMYIEPSYNLIPGQTILSKQEITGLYHGTSAESIQGILNSGKIETKVSKLDKIGQKSVSVTGNKATAGSYGNIIFELDPNLKVVEPPVGAVKGDYYKGFEFRSTEDIPINKIKSAFIDIGSKESLDTKMIVGWKGREPIYKTIGEIKQQLEAKGIKTYVGNFADKSQLTDFYNQAVRKITAKEKLTGQAAEITYKQLDDLAEKIKRKDITVIEFDELKLQAGFIEEAMKAEPIKKLLKFYGRKSPDNYTLSEILASAKPGTKAARIDEMTELGFRNLDEAQVKLNAYLNARENLSKIKTRISELRKEKSAVRKGERLMELAKGDRRMAYRAVREVFDLTDADLAKIRKGRDIMALSPQEFRQFISEAEKLGEEMAKVRNARIELETVIHEKELRKWENVRDVLKLPSVNEMNVEQLNKLNEVLSQYKTGDEFLPVRMMETLPRTRLENARTVREVLEILAKDKGLTVEQVSKIKVTEFHRFMGDYKLAREHPFFEWLVLRKNENILEANARIIELSDKLDNLIKAARISRKRGIIERLIPTDKEIVKWLESNIADRITLAEKMTFEELKTAEFMDNTFREYYDFLVKRHIEKQWDSRFVDKYFPHARRGFLEAWKEDGVLKAFKEMQDIYAQDLKYMDILNEQTGEILPYEKWIGFTQFRTDKLIPTANASRAFEAYVTALEKARHLDAMVPEIMAYVHALSPRKMTEHGLELDTSLKRFVKEWVNANKGRVPKGFFQPGGKMDWTLRSSMLLTRIIDLGFNFPTQAAAPIGEQMMNLTILKGAAYKTALIRRATKQGRDILAKYKNFVGRSLFDEMSRAANNAGDILMSGMFGIFHGAIRKGNEIFLLGKMTSEEFASGVISTKRLAELQVEMNKYRAVRGTESIMGRTAEAKSFLQYKSWAVPPLRATYDNTKDLIKILRQKGIKAAFASEEGKELFYSIGVGTAIAGFGWGLYTDLSKKKDRTFVEDITYKAMRDALSIYGTFDPSLWSSIRITGFFEDLSKALHDLILLEEYKTTGKLKGTVEFQRTVTPRVIKQIIPEEKEPFKKSIKSDILKKYSIEIPSRSDILKKYQLK